MRSTVKNERFVPPIMQAFRSAFRDHDSKKALDLRSDADERVIAGRRSSPRNAVSETSLRQELSEDLSNLLNTINLSSIEDLSGLEDVATSILNYGVADLTAISTEEIAVGRIGSSLQQVIETYEPRLVPGSLGIATSPEIDDISTRVRFHFNAEMYANPSDIAIEFVADVETDSGKMKISKL